jgi:hypothetical protein
MRQRAMLDYWDSMFGKNPTVYNKSTMITKRINCTIECTEQQLKELYDLLKLSKDSGRIKTESGLNRLYNDIHAHFNDNENAWG